MRKLLTLITLPLLFAAVLAAQGAITWYTEFGWGIGPVVPTASCPTPSFFYMTTTQSLYLCSPGSTFQPVLTSAVSPLATVSLSGQTANVSSTTLYTNSTGSPVLYRACGLLTISPNGTGTSYTAPVVKLTFTENGVSGQALVLNGGYINTCGTFSADSGTSIYYQTTGYGAGTGGIMSYNLALSIVGAN
jgi:hypothetical protein